MVSLIRKGLDITKDVAQKGVDIAKKPLGVLDQRRGQGEPESKREGNMKHYFCSLCRTSYGPVEAGLSDRFHPIKTLKGITSFVIKPEEGLPINLRKCPKCNAWICGNCWNIEKYKCRRCEPYTEVLDIPEGYPNLRTDYSNFKQEFYYSCDRCAREYGSGARKEDHVRFLHKCPECGIWSCNYCWNAERGKCLNCAPSFDPEVRFEKSLATRFMEQAIFICSQCRQEVGSVSKKKWKAGDEKKYLVQCSNCGKWVCGDCWNEEERQCRLCKPFSSPETRTERKGVNEYVFFTCALCRKEHGPINQKDWREMAKTGFRAVGVVGSVTGNPALVATGYLGTAAAGKGSTTVSIATIKRKSIKEIDYTKRFLARCPQCKRWVCLNCWDKLRGQCNHCEHKSEIEEESKFVPPTYVAAGDIYEGNKIDVRDSVISHSDIGGKGEGDTNVQSSIVSRSSIGEEAVTEETTRLQCSSCGGELQEGWKACPSCGESIVKRCLGCGEVVEQGWRVCPYCGGGL